jgi:hypothetical protein
MKKLLLLPQPRRITTFMGKHVLGADRFISFLGNQPEEGLFLCKYFQKALMENTGLRWHIAFDSPDERAVGISFRINKTLKQPQCYQLDIKPNTIEIVAADNAGIFYGISTLNQIIKQRKKILPCLKINDYPDYPARGVMLDISRSKVPQMETLYKLVDMLASWKINQLQLYTEHTFAYRGHKEVWENSSPMTADEIRNLEWYCKKRYVELVPNQNSFGHFERWLKFKKYAHLADDQEGTTLCPVDPGSIKFVGELYDELLPNFKSRLFNVGCDETNLGKGRSKEASEKKGPGRVYLDFLLKIYRLVKSHKRTMMFWGDIILNHPELVKELPKDIIALSWGYESDYPFINECRIFSKAKVPFYVCPGTSSWNAIGGRTENCIGNLVNAAENGLKFGAIGYLNTDWGDNGHWQYLPISYLGFAVGAGVSWCLKANRGMDVPKTIGLHAFNDPTGNMGCVAYELGMADAQTGKISRNCTALWTILYLSIRRFSVLDNMKPNGIELAFKHIDKAMSYVRKSRMACKDAPLIKKEFAEGAVLMKHACKRAVAIRQLSKGIVNKKLLRALSKDMAKIICEHKKLWLARNRSGGLDEGVARLQRCIKEYK